MKMFGVGIFIIGTLSISFADVSISQTDTKQAWNFPQFFSDADPDNRIVGGTETTIEKHPYQVSFVINQTSFCGGFIISPDFVMTAAHCVQSATPEVIRLRAGSDYSLEGGIIVPVADIQYHPSYNNPDFDNDIAVMRLEEPLNFTDKISSIEIATLNQYIPSNNDLTVTGWGRYREGSSISRQLMEVTIPTVNHALCRLSYIDILTDNMLCAGRYILGGKGPCNGDSGGPAVLGGVAVGVVSFARGCARPLSPSVFADIGALREWVAEQTGF